MGSASGGGLLARANTPAPHTNKLMKITMGMPVQVTSR